MASEGRMLLGEAEIGDGDVLRRIATIGRLSALPHLDCRAAEANFVRITVQPSAEAPGTDYRMFFRLKKESGPDCDLKMRVESVCSPTTGQAIATSAMTKVRFTLLVDKTFQGKRISFYQKH